MFQLRIFLSWNDVGSSWWGCEPRDYARSGRWPPLTPSLGSQPHHSAPTSIHSGKIPSWNKIFCDLGYPLSKSLAGKFEVFPSWSIFILSCLKEQENIISVIIFRKWKAFVLNSNSTRVLLTQLGTPKLIKPKVLHWWHQVLSPFANGLRWIHLENSQEPLRGVCRAPRSWPLGE